MRESFSASQNLSFFDTFFFHFSCFFRNPSWRALLAQKTYFVCKNHDFGTPFGFPGVPKWTLERPFSVKKSTKFQSFSYRTRPGADPAPHDPSKATPNRIFIDFYRFWMNFKWMFVVFGWILLIVVGFWKDCWWILLHFGLMFYFPSFSIPFLVVVVVVVRLPLTTATNPQTGNPQANNPFS